MYDVLIVGCGVIGAATAFELSKYRLNMGILERENDVATGTTKANSAILHAGYDPIPGTLMARLNVRGVQLAKELCQALDVPYRQCGSLVLAFSEEEVPTLEELLDRGTQNGVPGLKLLTSQEVRALEPNLSGDVVAALHAPSAAICSPWELCLALAETAVKNGAALHLETALTGLEREKDHWLVHTSRGDLRARFVVNAAGVDADTVHDLAAPHSFDIRPSRGEYFLLDKSEGDRVNHVVFQCPRKEGKGVLVAPTTWPPPPPGWTMWAGPPTKASPPLTCPNPSAISPASGPTPRTGRTLFWSKPPRAFLTWRASAPRASPPPRPLENTRQNCWPRPGWF